MHLNLINSRLVALIIPLSIMFAPYPVLGQFYNVGFSIILIYGIISIFLLNNKFLIPKSLLRFSVFIIIIYMINVLRTEGKSLEIFNFFIGSILTIFYVGVLVKNFKFELFYKVYNFLGIASSILVFYQGIMLFIFDVPAVPINLLPVPEADYHFWDYFQGVRPSGFFSEPQAFCSFIIPLLIFSLFRKKFIVSGLIFFSILISTSTLGLIISSFIIAFYFYLNYQLSFLRRILIFLFIVSGAFLMYNFTLLDFTLLKLNDTQIENNIRLIRGFNIYAGLDLVDLFLGISQDLQSYVIKNIDEDWVYSHIQNDNERLIGYTTSLSGLLIQYGFFSLIFYLLFLWQSFRKSNKEIRLFVITIFILCFGQTIIFNAWFVFYISILLGMLYERNILIKWNL